MGTEDMRDAVPSLAELFNSIAAAIHAKDWLSDGIRAMDFPARILALSTPVDQYTRLEYIESGGTQYINTGFTPNQDMRVAARVWFPAVPGSAASAIFGAEQGQAARTYSVFGFSGKYASTYGSEAGATPIGSVDSVFEIDKNKNVCTIAGTAFENGAYTFTCPGPMYLFARNRGGNVSAFASARLYGCQIYDNGVLVRDFVPCKDPAGAVGLYDAVSGQFYGNAGTGTFIAGPAVGGAADGEPVENTLPVAEEAADGESVEDALPAVEDAPPAAEGGPDIQEEEGELDA